MKKRTNKVIITLVLAFVMVISTFLVTQAEDTVDTRQIAWESYDEAKLDELGTEIPTKNGYLFAGWYKQECNGESIKEENNYLSSATISEEGGAIYAKFVPDTVLGVVARLAPGDRDGIDADVTRLCFVTTIDSCTYKAIGFKVKYIVDGVEKTKDTKDFGETYDPKLVYSSLRAMDENDNEVGTYYPHTTFSSVANHFKTVTLTGIPYGFCDTKIEVTPYWVTMDDKTVEGKPVTKMMSQGMEKLEDVYVASTGTDGRNSGTSESPLLTMTHALNRAKDTAIIHVQDDIEATAPVRVGEGHDITVQSAGNANATIYRGSALSEESMFVANSGGKLLIKNITLDGRTKDLETNSSSKALIRNQGTVNLDNAIVQNVDSTTQGGVLFMESGTTSEIVNSKFANNISTADGGAIYLALNSTGTVSTLTLTGTDSAMAVFDANKGARGGAIFIKEGSDEYQGNQVIASGYTFINNEATNAESGGGGAILDNGDDSSYEDCIFENNSGYQGGAYRVHSGCTTPEFINCTFKKNSATNNGGAIYGGASTTTMIDGCTFGGETTELGNAAGNVGGAIYLNAGKMVFVGTSDEKVIFANNSSERAGAIYINKGSIDAEYCQFNANKATNAAHGGGAIYNKGDASSTITNCTFTGNNATGSGGAIYDIATAGTEIDNCTFDSNDAESTENTAGGGAIYNANTGTTEIKNSTFAGNTAPSGSSNGYGGAVYTKVNMNITDTTFGGDNETDANVAKYGGAIYVNQGTLTLRGTDSDKAIFKNNIGTVGGAIGLFGESYTASVEGNIMAEGYKFISNSANSKGGGGAICNVGTEQSEYIYCTFENNKNNRTSDANGMAGAIYDASTGGSQYTNCTFTSNSNSKGKAGAIYDASTNGSTYTDSTFVNNSAANGGAIYDASTEGNTYTRSTFQGNNVTSQGGAIYDGSAAGNTYIDCTFTGNSANYGGAIHDNSTSSTTYSGCVFESNNVSKDGGAIYDQSSANTEYEDCTFKENSATNDGGVIYINSNKTVTFTGIDENKAVFQENSAENRAGAIFIKSGNVSAEGYTFASNTASNAAGAILDNTSGSMYKECIFSGNTSKGDAGAYQVHSDVANPTFTECEFTGNTAVGNGNAIYGRKARGTFTLNNCTYVKGDMVVVTGGSYTETP